MKPVIPANAGIQKFLLFIKNGPLQKTLICHPERSEGSCFSAFAEKRFFGVASE